MQAGEVLSCTFTAEDLLRQDEVASNYVLQECRDRNVDVVPDSSASLLLETAS